MNTTGTSMDATSKRWLVALAIAFLAGVAALTHSFMKAFSAAEQSDTNLQPAVTDRTEEVHTFSQPAWIHPQEFHAAEEHQAATSPSVSDGSEATPCKKNETVREEMVHKQAECLRSLVKQNKLPAAYGHLTLDQIDDMEKKGIVIE